VRNRRSVRVVPGATDDRREDEGREPAQRNERPQYRSPGIGPRLPSDPNSFSCGPNVTGRRGEFGRRVRPGTPPNPANGPSTSEGDRATNSQLPAHSSASLDTLQLLHELSGRATIQTWLFLYWEGHANASQMRRLLKPGQDAIDGALGRLVRMGLAEHETLRSFPFTKVYSLTKRGRKLAETPIPSWPNIVVK
jgi:DNA-binding HxlR family transcriptional regulator